MLTYALIALGLLACLYLFYAVWFAVQLDHYCATYGDPLGGDEAFVSRSAFLAGVVSVPYMVAAIMLGIALALEQWRAHRQAARQQATPGQLNGYLSTEVSHLWRNPERGKPRLTSVGV